MRRRGGLIQGGAPIFLAASLLLVSGSSASLGDEFAPRIAPLTPSEVVDVTGRVATVDPQLARSNFLLTLLRNRRLYDAWSPFGLHMLKASTLTPRQRELAILRIGWLNRSAYVFSHHARIGKEVGLTQDDIELLKQGPESPVWGTLDRAILRAVDQLRHTNAIDEATWRDLAAHLDQGQVMDLIATIGQYNATTWFLNATRVRLEPWVERQPVVPP